MSTRPHPEPSSASVHSACLLTPVHEPDFLALAARLELQRRFSADAVPPTTVVVFDDRGAEAAFCAEYGCSDSSVKRLALTELLSPIVL